MQTLDFTGENAAIIGDTFGPIPFEFTKTGFDFTGSTIKFEVYKEDPSDLKFDKTLVLVITAGKVASSLYLTKEESATTKGDYKYRVRIAWPNGNDENTIYGGVLPFKNEP